jgi:competence protein ComEA
VSVDRTPSRPDPLAVLRAPAPGRGERLRRLVARIPPEARPWAIALAGLVAVVLVGGGWVAVRAASAAHTSPPVESDPQLDLPYAGTTTSPPTTGAPLLVVDAAGAVAQPGVYRLAVGSRVADLVSAAGGAAADADIDRLNLAAALADGARVYVPRRGESDVPAVDGGGTDPAPAGLDAEPTVVELNHASAQVLETLPGVGPAIAQAIIDHRQSAGAYRSVDDLLDVRGIGPARLEQLRPHVKV